MQTGPAVREDKLVMEKHIDFLKMNPNYQKIYQVVSESIIEMKSISQSQIKINKKGNPSVAFIFLDI